MMKGEVVTPYTGKVLLPEAWVHHAGIDRFCSVRLSCAVFVILLVQCPRERLLKLSREIMQHVAMLFHLIKTFSLRNACC